MSYSPFQVTKQVQSTGNPARGGSAPTQVFLNGFSGWKFAVGDSIYFTMIVPLDWNPSKDFIFEQHWYSPNVTATRYVRFQLNWAAIAIGGTITAPHASGVIDSGDILMSTTANTLIESTATIAGTNFLAGDHISIQLTRIASTGTAPAAGDNPVWIHQEVEYGASGDGIF